MKINPNEIKLFFEVVEDKVYYEVKDFLGKQILKGKASIHRFMLIKNKIQSEYPKYSIKEEKKTIPKKEVNTKLNLEEDRYKKAQVTPKKHKPKYRFPF